MAAHQETGQSRFWVGPDVAANNPTVVHSGEKKPIPVTIYPYHIPLIFTPTPEQFTESTRSRWAQLGLSVEEGAAKNVLNEVEERKRARKASYFTGMMSTTIPVINHSTQDMEVDKRFCRFKVDGPALLGESLVSKVGKLNRNDEGKPIRLSGTPGDDWMFIYDNGHDDQSTVVGIYMKIDPKSRMWIPKNLKPEVTSELLNKNGQLTMPDEKGYDFRGHVKKLLEPVPSREDDILWIGKTISELHLSGRVHAILDKAVVSNVRKSELDRKGTHINSLLLEGGETHWQIVVEILGPTVEDLSSHYVAVFFASE